MFQNLNLNHFKLKHFQQFPMNFKLKLTKLPQTSVPLDHGAYEVVHKEGGMDTCGTVLGAKKPWGGRMEHIFELADNVPSTPHDSPLPGGYTHGSDEGRMKLDELITLYKDFEELDDHMENVEEETVDAATTRVSTASAPVNEGIESKEKGVAIIDVEGSSRIVRPVRSITTFQPLPNIDPKTKKVAQQGKTKAQKIVTNVLYAKEFDEIQARIVVDHELAKEQESTKSDKEAAVDYEHEKEELRMWKCDRLDLVDLHRLVMKRFEDTTPEGYNLLLWGDLKVMFEPSAEDEIWSILSSRKLLSINVVGTRSLEAEAREHNGIALLKFS
ncbi:hypothetical protein Tco_1061755 [Tanacetum coccineum]